MADSRTFTLIGEFKDGITPELAKINQQLASLKSSFGNIGGKGARGSSRDMGRLSAAVSSLTSNLKLQNQELRAAVAPLRQYRSEIGKTVSAYKQLNQAGGNVRGLEATNRALAEQVRLLNQVRAASGRQRMTPRGGGYTAPPRGGRGGGGTGGYGGGMGAHMAEFGFAFTLGNAISQPITNAIVAGFQIGVSLMTKPFEYFANQLKERIEDEQSDIKAAGGIFSIARRQKDPFVKTMDEAMEFTQTNNKYMAELADALPGNTQQYIEVSKRISDSISRIVMADPTKAIQYSNKLREEEGKQALEGSTQAQTKGAITQLLGEMTKKTVLAGLGTGGGPGGVAGAYGLPQLTERMLTQDQVSMGQFQRYAAIFKDPLIMDALNRFIPKINASAAGTLDRFEVMKKFYDEVLPKDMIRKFERSTAGVLELFNTTIFGPETGLFGLGRKMEGMGKVMDDYGNYIKVFEDGTRKVVGSMAEASDANLSLFDLLRDSFANLGIALYPILSNMSAIFDPINKVSKLLIDFRHATGEFLNAFESYKKGFEDMVKDMDAASKKEFLKIGLDLRASLAAVNNFFANAGIIDEGQFQANAKQLMSTTFDYKGMMSGMLDTFLNSDVAGKLGEMIGEIVGTVLSEVAKVTGFISGRLKQSNKLFEGLKKGFEEAGGPAAFKNIFLDVFRSLRKVLLEVMSIIPFEGYMLMAAMVIVPAAIQGLGMLIAEKMVAGILSMGKKISKGIPAQMAAAGGKAGNGRALRNIGAAFLPGTARQRVSTMRGMQQRGSNIAAGVRAAATRHRAKMFGANQYSAPIGPVMAGFQRPGGRAIMQSELKGLPAAMKGIKEFGKAAMPVAKKLPMLSIALGALDFGMRKAGGESTGSAAGGAIGGTAGGIAGAALGSALGPAGTVAGGILGAWLGDWLGTEIGKAIENLGSVFSGLPAKLSASWESLKKWVADLPVTIGYAIGSAIANLQKSWSRLSQWWTSLGPKFDQWVNSMIKGAQSFLQKAGAWLSNGSNWMALGTAIVNGIKSGVMAVVNAPGRFINWVGGGFQQGLQAGYRETQTGYTSTATQSRQANANGIFNWNAKTPGAPRYKGGLGDAIASELKNKPSGSNLVIANSSETVIPAAGGYGMKAFMDVLASGFTAVNRQYQSLASGVNTLQTDTRSQFQQTETKNSDRHQQTTTKINDYQKQTQSEFTKINQNIAALTQQVSTMSSMGGMMGGMGGAGGMALGGGYGSGGVRIAGMLGNYIKATGGAPGSIWEHPWHGGVKGKHASGSYHYSGRAIDIGAYAGEQAGVIARIKQFNAQYGVKPVEFLHAGNDPNHQDHVHVAYALGAQNPAFFGSQNAALAWERSMVPGSVKVGSVTGNSAEGFGGGTTVTNNITINQQPGQDADALATLVAIKIGEAVADARAASIFV